MIAIFGSFLLIFNNYFWDKTWGFKTTLCSKNNSKYATSFGSIKEII